MIDDREIARNRALRKGLRSGLAALRGVPDAEDIDAAVAEYAIYDDIRADGHKLTPARRRDRAAAPREGSRLSAAAASWRTIRRAATGFSFAT